MKHVQIILELALAWIMIISLYLFRNNYEIIIYAAGVIMVSWFYVLARNIKWSEHCPCEDELLGGLFITWIVGSVIMCPIMKAGIGLEWSEVGIWWIGASAAIGLFTNLRLTYLVMNPKVLSDKDKDN